METGDRCVRRCCTRENAPAPRSMPRAALTGARPPVLQRHFCDASCGHAAAAPPSNEMNSPRLMPNMGSLPGVPPPIIAASGRRRGSFFCRTSTLPMDAQPVLGADHLDRDVPRAASGNTWKQRHAAAFYKREAANTKHDRPRHEWPAPRGLR